MLVTLGRFNINEVLPFKTDEKIRKEYTSSDGKTYKVWMNSERYKLFSKSRICCCCGLEGTYFLLQNNDSNQDDITTGHFNLFGDDPELGPTKFTKDHINPKSKGGKNTADNYRTMCFMCNFLRGTNNIPFEVIVEARKSIKEHGLTNAIFAIKDWIKTKMNI